MVKLKPEPLVVLFLHPGITLPLALNVTLDATVTVAEIATDVLKGHYDSLYAVLSRRRWSRLGVNGLHEVLCTAGAPHNVPLIRLELQLSNLETLFPRFGNVIQ
jgi:hypothetical protein